MATMSWKRHLAAFFAGLAPRVMVMAALSTAGLALPSVGTAAPDSFEYIGALTAGSVPATANIEISLFDQAVGGSAVWGPQSYPNTPVTSGMFRVTVGSGSTPDLGPALLTPDNIWIEVAIDGETLSPRQRLGSVAYAQVARHARGMMGTDAANYVTDADIADNPSNAFTSPVAPSSPEAGALWFNPTSGVLSVWNQTANQWRAIAGPGIDPSNLPPDVLDSASNGMLSNEFSNVSHLWSTGANIADATLVGDGAPAIAEVTVVEAADSFTTQIQVLTNFSLTSGNDVRMTLFPPPATGIAPIILRDGALPFGSYGDIWTVDNTPALAQLVNINPAGLWTVAIVDLDNNLSDAGANLSGTLNSLEVRYDIVRSDNVTAAGLFEAQAIEATNIFGDLLPSQSDGAISGALRTTGEVTRPIELAQWSNNQNTSGNIPNRTLSFTKTYDDSTIMVTYSEPMRANTTGDINIEMRVNGNNCSDPGIMRFRHRTPASSNGYASRPSTLIGFCDAVSGIGDGTSIPAGTYTLQIYSNNSMYFGYDNSQGSLTVEEIW